MQAYLERLVPSHAELLEARAFILEHLSGTDATEAEIVHVFLERKGLTATAPRQVTVDLGDAEWRQALTADPAVVGVRLREAVRMVLSELYRDGVIAQRASGERGVSGAKISLETRGGSGSTRGSVTVPHSGFATELRPRAPWSLVDRMDHPRTVYGRDELAADFRELLGERGVEVMREAVACLRAGRYLAAVDLLAAASEAAWHGVAATVPGEDSTLDRHVQAGTNAAEVIHRTGELLARSKVVDKQLLNDVRAQAARFRDIRNYGLHPTGAQDVTREDAFTEAGATVLFMTAGRYFSILAGAQRALLAATNATVRDD